MPLPYVGVSLEGRQHKIQDFTLLVNEHDELIVRCYSNKIRHTLHGRISLLKHENNAFSCQNLKNFGKNVKLASISSFLNRLGSNYGFRLVITEPSAPGQFSKIFAQWITLAGCAEDPMQPYGA